MSTSESKPEAGQLLLSGASIAAISAVGYLLAFAYEVGYVTPFAIPLRFIEVGLTTVFVAVLGLTATLVTIGLIINAIYPFVSARSSIAQRILIRISPFVLMYLTLVIIYRRLWIASLFLFWLGFTLFGEFVWPLITQREKGTYREKLEAQEELEDYWTGRLLLGSIVTTPKRLFGFHAFCTLILLVLFAFCMGDAEAERQKHFLVVAGGEDVAVLRSYGTRLVCAPFDRDTAEVKRSIILLDTSVESPVRLNWEAIGPLKLESDKEK